MTTKLEAINMCLAGIGRDPVASEDDPDLDAGMAATVIDNLNSDMQTQGWWFNKEYNWRLTPDAEGNLFAPNTALSVLTEGANRGNWLSLRGRRLYDMVNHTYDLSSRLYNGEITLSFIMEIPFEDTPPVFRKAVAYTARRMFAQDLEVDQVRWKMQVQDEERAVLQLQRQEVRHRRHNALTDNPSTASYILEMGGPNSNAYTVSVFPKRDLRG